LNLFAPEVTRPEIRAAGARTPVSPPPPAPRQHINAQAVSLLGEILARLHGLAKPVVQVVPAMAGQTPDQVAFDLAVAASAHLGRTLLVSAGLHESPDLSGARELAWRMTRLLGGVPDTIMPDALVACLYHAQPVGGAMPIPLWKNAAQDFQLILLDCPPIATHPQTLAAARGCDGAVLTVAAGVTRMDHLRAAQRQLASAQVPVLGTVLHDAMRMDIRPPWRKRSR